MNLLLKPRLDLEGLPLNFLMLTIVYRALICRCNRLGNYAKYQLNFRNNQLSFQKSGQFKKKLKVCFGFYFSCVLTKKVAGKTFSGAFSLWLYCTL